MKGDLGPDPAAWVALQLTRWGDLMPEMHARELILRALGGSGCSMRQKLRGLVVLREISGAGYVMTSEVCWRLVSDAGRRRLKIRCNPLVAQRRGGHPLR